MEVKILTVLPFFFLLLKGEVFYITFLRFQAEKRDLPGIDCAYLAMDTEEGVEVVWNEVQFSERKNFKAQEEKIQLVFENLTQLEHPNIVKFHRYWTDTHNDKPRVSRYIRYEKKKTNNGHLQIVLLILCFFFLFFLGQNIFTGNIHNGIYVVGIVEAVPQKNKA